MASSTLSQRFAAPGRVWGRGYVRMRLAALCLLALAALLLLRGPSVGTTRGDAEGWINAWLARRGLSMRPGQLVWLAPPRGPFGLRPLLLVAHRAGELDDIYYVELRTGDTGAVLDAWWLTNVTRSSSASEGNLTQLGPYVAFLTRLGEQTDAVGVLDTRGEGRHVTRGWPAFARAQNALTNLQETGRLQGFGRRYYRFVSPPQSIALSARDGHFVARADGAKIVIDPERLRPALGAPRVRVQQVEKGRPGTITWLVDVVRNVSWIGPEPVAWLEHSVFGLTDRLTRAYHGLVHEDTGAEMRDALAVPHAAPRPRPAEKPPEPEPKSLLTEPDPELRWPPPPLHRVINGRVRGEGQWLPLSDDPFVNTYPNAPPAFYQTFIRVDPDRPYTSVYITLWDPRQVQLHVAMGTKEPESATGETGSGEIPREPDVLARLVGAFNGGFQAMHGEFGMMAEGNVYLPPKPYAATVAVFDDGRVGMGSWPGPGREGWDEERANAQIPRDMIAMRQNLTSVVENGVYNPWDRWWWGAAPTFAQEQTYIARSGLCLTSEGYMAFLWGESMGPEELGKAMLALRCVRGMHLDMNSKHTGFELYHPTAPGKAEPPLGRALREMEYDGPIERGLGFRFRARLAVKTMSPLRFPRYLQRDPRDFFFLTLKAVLPGPEVQVDAHKVAFSSAGLPQVGWPAAFARARLGEETKPGTWLLRIDPARAVPAPLAPAELEQPLARLAGVEAAGGTGALALYAVHVHGHLRYCVGEPPADATIVLRGPELKPGVAALRALGVDHEGFLLYAETTPEQAPGLGPRLRQAGVARALMLPDESRLAFAVGDKSVAVDGRHEVAQKGGLALLAETRPAAQVIFADVKPRPYYRWGALQGQRVRYFPTGQPRFRAPEEALNPPGQPPPDAGVPRASLR